MKSKNFLFIVFIYAAITLKCHASFFNNHNNRPASYNLTHIQLLEELQHYAKEVALLMLQNHNKQKYLHIINDVKSKTTPVMYQIFCKKIMEFIEDFTKKRSTRTLNLKCKL